MANVEMTSLSAEMNKQVAFDEVSEAFVFHFGRVFSCKTAMVDLSQRASSGG
jgi:hypothetical protein